MLSRAGCCGPQQAGDAQPPSLMRKEDLERAGKRQRLTALSPSFQHDACDAVQRLGFRAAAGRRHLGA